MSNTEAHPAERVCANEPPPPGAAPAGTPPLEMLPPREVPLGGPRAMGVRRVLPQRERSLVGAWCFLDSYGPEDVAAGGMRVARHPHTGLATVSWLFEGRIDHLDSAGNWATVRPGEVHLMNAGAGITHQEFSTADTGVLHGVQLWYAFPDRARFSEPSLASHRPEPVLGPGYAALVFAGTLLGASSPIRTHLPLTGADLRLEPGARLDARGSRRAAPAGIDRPVMADQPPWPIGHVRPTVVDRPTAVH
ncbi:pirin family protein, partial [Rothia sp. AR01]